LTFLYTLTGLIILLGVIIFGLVFALIQLGQTKEEVRESEMRFRQFFENEPEYCYMISPEGVIVDINNSALNILGYKEAEIVGKPLEAIYAPESLPKMKRLLGKWQKTGKLADEEMVIITKKGNRRMVLLSAGIIKDTDGNVLNSISVQKDITDRKQAEEALQESEEKYRELINGMNDTAWVIDFKGNFVDVNNAAVKILGYSREELLSMGPQDIDTSLDSETIMGLIRGMQTDKLQVFETTHTTKGGKKIPVEINSSLVTYRGKKAILSIARDITERKQAEIKLQRSYDQMRETFIATVNTLAETVEKRDPYTAGHQRRATILSCAIAAEIGLPEEQFDGLHMAGLVHDIGKITVPAEILSKPGQLNSTQNEMVKAHPQAGYDILKGIAFPWPVAEIVLQHHERMDGSGYPQGLSGAEIMLEARILAVADVVEAMASHRPHRPGYGIDEALEEIFQNRGVLYDPDVVDICLKLFNEKGFSFDQSLQITEPPQNI
jgi:PAS domain S-box-containing protein